MAKILGICGSVRKGATEYIVRQGLELMGREPGVQVEFMTLRGKKIQPCTGCDACKKKQSWCILKDDMQEMTEQFLEADAYYIGSPVYVHTVTPQLMAFFSRLRPVVHMAPEKFKNKFGAGVAVGGTRNGGEEAAVLTLIQMMMAREINIVSNESRGYIGGKIWSRDILNFTREDDELGMKTALELAQKLARTVMIFQKGKEAMGL